MSSSCKISGCPLYIGNIYCGSLGYADDVVLLAPSVTSLNAMLTICTEYASEYGVLFNPVKSKFILCQGKIDIHIPNITFMGKPIERVPWDNHLGYPVGSISDAQLMNDVIRNFMSRVNMVKSHFKLLPPDIIYNMFKTYCMPLYGCPLWNYTSKYISKFYTAWRKAVRYILNIPYTTHCDMLPFICDDVPIYEQLYSRFSRFFVSLKNSDNIITRTCAALALNGSGSYASNNISLICEYQYIDRVSMSSTFIGKSNTNMNMVVKSNVVRELLFTKFNLLFECHNNGFTQNECDLLINYLCTD